MDIHDEILRLKARRNAVSEQDGIRRFAWNQSERPGQYRRQISNRHSHQQKPSAAFAEVRNSRCHKSDNKQRYEQPQEVAEYGIEGQKYAYRPSWEKEAAPHTEYNGQQYFRQQSDGFEFL